MNYSDIVGSISGVLQFVVACYALRVSRIFGIARVGWLFFGAFSLMAVVHVLLSVHPFGYQLELGPGVNVLYEIISVLLLANIAQMEAMLWKRRQKAKAELQSQSDGESKANQLSQQLAELTKAKEESQLTTARLQAELAQEKQIREQEKQATAQSDQSQKILQEQLASGQKAEEDLRAIASGLQSQLEQQKQTHAQEKEVHERAIKTLEELLSAAHQSEHELQATIAALQTELAARPPQPLEQPAPAPAPVPPPMSVEAVVSVDEIERKYHEQLAASHRAEEELRTMLVESQAEVADQKQAQEHQRQKQEQTQQAYRDLLASLRQSGIAEVANMAQSRVAYIARITNLMREHSRDIGKFMTRHPRGKQLPNALALMIEYLSDEQFLLLKRIDSVKTKLARLTDTAMEPLKIEIPEPELVEVDQSEAEAPEPNVVAAEPPAKETPAQPALPSWNPPAPSGSTDFLSHLIENVTETGTGLVPQELESDSEEEDAPFIDPENFHSQV